MTRIFFGGGMSWVVFLYLILANLIPLVGMVLLNWGVSSIFQFYLAECYLMLAFDILYLRIARGHRAVSGPSYMLEMMLFPPICMGATAILVPSNQPQPWMTFLPWVAMSAVFHGLKYVQTVLTDRTAYLQNYNDIVRAGMSRVVVIMMTFFFGPFLGSLFIEESTISPVALMLVAARLGVDVSAASQVKKAAEKGP